MPETDLLQWLLASVEPWTRYRTLVDLLAYPLDVAEVQAAYQELLAHAGTRELLTRAATWGEQPLKRHNDAGHPLYALSTLADFGLRADAPGLTEIAGQVMAHQAPEGPFQTFVLIPRAFGGSDTAAWSWMACDAPTLLYVLLAWGLGSDPRVQRAAAHLVAQVADNGYRCTVAPELGSFRGPGRRTDPCPMANVYALKALSLLPEHRDGPAARQAAEMLLEHWAQRREKKYYLFGMGTDFRKLKYPYVYYDLLHVAAVLSHFPFVYSDPRFHELLEALTTQADADGRYTAGSMYQPWKGWSFADKKAPSPWLTLLVLRIQKRLGQWAPA